MKHNKILLTAGVIASMLTMGSCVGDLDLTPTDPSTVTPGTFASDPQKYLEEAIAGVYFQYATYGANGNAAVQGFDGGMSTFQRAVFILEEVPTDEASWIPNDADYGLFQYGVIPSSNTVVMGTYSRLLINITMCNQFIQTVQAGYFNLDTQELRDLADEYVRQARILRAGAYWYAIDCFGNVPYADENIQMGEIAPQLEGGRAEVYNLVVSDLEDIVAWYKANDPNNKPPYGYVGLDVAEALLVKFYLNAGVYNNGNTAYDKCYQHAKAIIDRLGHGGYQNSGLCYSYFQNFGANNKDYVIGGPAGVNEIIWTIPQQLATQENGGVGLQSYANSTFMCNAWIGDAPGDAPFQCTQAEYNSKNGWKCIVCRPEFVTQQWEGWDASYRTCTDLRTSWWKTAANGFALQNVDLTQANWGYNGYLNVKYTNWAFNNDGTINTDLSPEATDQLGGDYAMIRLAEIYLSAAEAIVQGGGGSLAEAENYINLTRNRAGIGDFGGTLNMNEIKKERCRELYCESTRRSDLIRYGEWISGYTWSWKNDVAEGADYPSYFTVYPLPSTVVARNGYIQNTGY